MTQQADMIIIGGGMVGLTTALACASKDLASIVIDREDTVAQLDVEFDGRASAIAASSFQMYRHLGIAERLGAEAQPIHDILISDGEVDLGVSPLTLHFNSREAGDMPMGYMVENRALRKALIHSCQDSRNINLVAPATVSEIIRDKGKVSVALQDGKLLSAALLVAADGRNSFTRRHAGISVENFHYNQKAIVTTVEHEKPHHGVAHELFLPNGPFAILPITGHRSSIVWTDSPHAVDAAMALPDDAFAAELSRRFGDHFGDVRPCAPRWSYPLSLQMAETYIGNRLALVGDAAHAIHPIAGQGLNMGLRDAAALADVLSIAKSNGLDIGGPSLSEYEVWRNFDNRMLAISTDILNRLFSNNISPIKHARRLGIGLIDRLPFASKFFIKEAAGQMGELPSLLR